MPSKHWFAFLTFLAALGVGAAADDQIRNVQTELKNLGFYYAEVTGQSTPETAAAIRRYQIRNGLEVTGTLTAETLSGLGIGGSKSTAKTSPPRVQQTPPAASEPKPRPPVNLRRNDSVEESDRTFLRREEAKRQPDTAPSAPPPPTPRDPSVVQPPAPLNAPSPDFPVLFSNTPYATAPLEIQQQTLIRAQAFLANRGYYRDIIDGLPGPATEEAILSYQRYARLPLTGRLDLQTLAALRLLPGRGDSAPAQRTEPSRSAPQRVFRGIWVN